MVYSHHIETRSNPMSEPQSRLSGIRPSGETRGQAYANRKTEQGRSPIIIETNSPKNPEIKPQNFIILASLKDIQAYVQKLNEVFRYMKSIHSVDEKKRLAYKQWLERNGPDQADIDAAKVKQTENFGNTFFSQIRGFFKLGLAASPIIGATVATVYTPPESAHAQEPENFKQETMNPVLTVDELEKKTAIELAEYFTYEELEALKSQLVTAEAFLKSSTNQDIRMVNRDGVEAFFIGDMFILTKPSPRSQTTERFAGRNPTSDNLLRPGEIAPGHVVIDQAIYITPSAMTSLGGRAAAEAMITEYTRLFTDMLRANGTDQNGNIPGIRPVLVETAPDPSEPNGTAMNDYMINLNAGMYPEIIAGEERTGADMTLVFFPPGMGCGIGNLLNFNTLGTIQYSIAGVTPECLIDLLTAAHEGGHNLGFIHNPETGEIFLAFHPDQQGHVEPGLGRDVMAYPTSACLTTPEMWCPVIPMFSNYRYEIDPENHPNVKLGIQGVADIARTMADMARLVSEVSPQSNSPEVRGYRITSMAPPSITDGEPLHMDGTTTLHGSTVRYKIDNGEWIDVEVNNKNWSIDIESLSTSSVVYIEVDNIPYVLIAPIIFQINLPQVTRSQ